MPTLNRKPQLSTVATQRIVRLAVVCGTRYLTLGAGVLVVIKNIFLVNIRIPYFDLLIWVYKPNGFIRLVNILAP